MLQLLIGLATALTGGVVAAFVTYRLNATKEHVFHMRRKAEELFLAFDKHDKQVGMHHVPYYPLMKGELDYNALLDLQLKSENDGGEAAANFKMLSSIYFPQLHEKVRAFEEAVSGVNQVISEHKRAYKMGDGSGFLRPLDTAVKHQIEASKALRASIVAEGRKMMGVSSLWPDVERLAAYSSRLNPRQRGRGQSR